MFRVEWLQSALDELAAVWVPAGSALRQAITTAAHEAELQLQRNPEEEGESRPRGDRVHFALPLGINYEVEVESRTVVILHVWCIRPRRK